ncbi:MAG: glycoside hydrolase family 31 protein [Candidatus Marinimicrobia bacterium]|nr:glycoside hydrolase family 31 protein [Candidatus Neomarinimicrobiota bacterium]MCF7880808.1 glycoside hydrolase family 31 protein [Candidatus Neomarinimicrobiota bacterium]
MKYQQDSEIKINIMEGEHWWVGVINHGHQMPLSDGYEADLNGYIYGNQAQPVLVSSEGRSVWSDEPFHIEVKDNRIDLVKTSGEFVLQKHGSSLREAYLGVSRQFFPPTGKMPDESLFTQPQYNTWIELTYDQNQQDILTYARGIIANGFPPGVIMIDDNWQRTYGDWEFRAERFDDPKAMVQELHEMGFKVMLWVCPFISPDTEIYRDLRDRGLLLKDKKGYPKIVRWWNGQSALLDLTQPEAKDWFLERLHYLEDTYGVDGFKLDAGDPEYYVNAIAHENISPNEHSRLFAEIGLHFPLNEYRATWKMGGQPLAQRLRDKGHSWDDLNTLIPHILTQGLSGYAFTCPDMIGGGLIGSFEDLETVDQELIVRSAQTHALMPMMQFSVAPWRVLDRDHLKAVKKAVDLRAHFTDKIMKLARVAAETGEPIVRHLEYEFPGQGYATVSDQFLLGDSIMVAPLLQPEQDSREIIIPPGVWKSNEGDVVEGPATITTHVALDEIPYYTRIP